MNSSLQLLFSPLNKNQNSKFYHDFAHFEKNCSFLPTLAPFHMIFRHIRHIQFVCYLDFQKMKKDLENFFLAATRLTLEKNIF